MSDIHVGYRGGAFSANFDSIFRTGQRPAERCNLCRWYRGNVFCVYHDEVTGPSDWCPTFEPINYEGD